MSKKFTNVYDQIIKVIPGVMFLYVLSISGSIFTQKELTEKQFSDTSRLIVLSLSLLIIHFNTMWYRDEIRHLLHQLAVVLRSYYNDKDLEQKMIMKIKLISYSFCLLGVSVPCFRGLKAFVDATMEDVTFAPVVTVWPDVKHKSKLSSLVRIIFYIIWWLYSWRNSAAFTLIITMVNGVRYQFKNLQSYFYSLDRIFYDEELNQTEKENKYEREFRLGIYMHIRTLWCAQKYKLVCSVVFSVEVALCVFILVTVIIQLISNHELSTLLEALSLGMITLFILGVFMWSCGDISADATDLSEAMYASGWQNCYGQSSVRIRKLVVNAMGQAQKPVVFRAFRIVDMSYEMYVKIIKTSYSIVSVFY